MTIHIAVLIKQVLDPEIPTSAFRIDRERKRPDVPWATHLMSVFDANALELALKLRDLRPNDTTVTALTLGGKSAVDVLRKALAVTADSAILIDETTFPALDSPGKARIFAAAICKLGSIDLVIAGRQAADWEDGQVGGMLAEALGWPCVSFVSRLALDGERIQVRRDVDDGFQVYRLAGPTVLTATNGELTVLRIAKVRDVMAATRKPITTWTANDLGIHSSEMNDPAVDLVDLFVPELPRCVEMVDGDTAADRAHRLAERLRELNVL